MKALLSALWDWITRQSAPLQVILFLVSIALMILPWYWSPQQQPVQQTVTQGVLNAGSNNPTTITNNNLPTEHLQVIREQAKQLGVHEGAMQSFFAILNEKNVPPEQWPAKLQEIATRHLALLKQVEAFATGSTAMDALAQQARAAINATHYDQADALLTQLLQLQQQEQEQGQSKIAATWTSRAELAMTRLRYTEAARHFAQAAQSLPQSQQAQRLDLLEQEADAWYMQGDEFGDNDALKQAIQRRKQLLTLHPRANEPLEWARMQNNLGIALNTLGKRESGTENLKAAIDVYQNALKEYTQERVPLDWAATQNNLGIALKNLGERESGTENLKAAVNAFQNALKEYTQERVPLDWAMTQNNLGNALRNLGERESGTENLKAAVEAYQNALKEGTQERVPLQWATTQNNLGNALRYLGEREDDPDKLEAAMVAYQNALQVATTSKADYYIQATSANIKRLQSVLEKRKTKTDRK